MEKRNEWTKTFDYFWQSVIKCFKPGHHNSKSLKAINILVAFTPFTKFLVRQRG